MPLSNYPNGFADGVTIRGMPLLSAYPGKVVWVHASTGSNGNAGTFDRPFATIDYAIGRCTANKGDIVMVKAGHTETVAAAGGIALDVAGVAIVGLGWGALRPTINFTATASTFTVSAANCIVQNILFTGGIDAVVSPLVVSAADFLLLDCEYRDVTGQCTAFLLTTAGASRMTVRNFRHDGDAAAGSVASIAIVGGDRILLEDVWIDGNFSTGAIDIRTTATTDLEVRNLIARTRNAADVILVDTITGSTGTIGPNIFMRLNDNAANFPGSISGATFVYHNPISIVNLAGEMGAIDTTSMVSDAFKTKSTSA